MSPKTTLRDVVSAPVTILTAVLTLVLGLVGVFDPVIQFVGATAGLWFPAISIFSGVLNPRLELVPASWATWLIVAAGLLYLTYLVESFGDRLAGFLKDR